MERKTKIIFICSVVIIIFLLISLIANEPTLLSHGIINDNNSEFRIQEFSLILNNNDYNVIGKGKNIGTTSEIFIVWVQYYDLSGKLITEDGTNQFGKIISVDPEEPIEFKVSGPWKGNNLVIGKYEISIGRIISDPSGIYSPGSSVRMNDNGAITVYSKATITHINLKEQ